MSVKETDTPPRVILRMADKTLHSLDGGRDWAPAKVARSQTTAEECGTLELVSTPGDKELLVRPEASLDSWRAELPPGSTSMTGPCQIRRPPSSPRATAWSWCMSTAQGESASDDCLRTSWWAVMGFPPTGITMKAPGSTC